MFHDNRIVSVQSLQKEPVQHLCKRKLVFMTYVNNVENGGTEFYYQDIKCPAKKGLTLIWPADWTHTHRGVVDESNEKMIITGWFNYEDNRTDWDKNE